MKNFTLFLAFFMMAFMANAQSNKNIQNKFQLAHEKYAKISQKSELATNLIKKNSLKSESFLKSAATKQKLDSIVWRDLNSETQLWQNGSKDEYIYDAELKNTVTLSKEWDVNVQAWDIRSKTELGYNKNRVNFMLMYMSIETGQVPTLTSKFLIYYNAEGIQDSLWSYSTETAGTTWVLDMRQINYYNASKQLTKMDIWALDENSGTMTLSMIVEYTYTASGKIKTSSSYYNMEGEKMLWSKTDYNYDAAGKLISTEDSDLSFATFVLEKSYRSDYQYNALGDVSVEIYSNWSGTAWEEMEKDENIYSSTNFSDIVFPSFYMLNGIDETTGLTLNKQITGVNSFEKIAGNWKNTGKAVYYYSGGTSTKIDEMSNTQFTAYPNPASGSVSFRWKGNYDSLTLEMYQITGVKALEQTVYAGKVVQISNLENGIYFFKLLNGQQPVHTGKLIKK